ncbi:MAG TPA: hypothetical protein VF549_02120 [Solirubrobacteraceae bacterium]|jgi:hypothetical protein
MTRERRGATLHGMSLRTALLTVAALFALGSTSASAMTLTDYKVVVEGSGTYVRHDAAPGPFGDWTQADKAQFTWRSEFPTVEFIDNHVTTASSPKVTAAVQSASTTLTIPTPEGPKVGSCTGTSWSELPTPAIIQGSTEHPEGATSEGIFLKVMEGGTILLNSCSGTLKGGTAAVGLAGAGTGRAHPYDQFFEMPHEAIGMGKIIQLLSKDVTGTSCPGYGEYTDSCSLKWKATVTFTRTFTSSVGEPEVKPPPQEEQPQPPPPPANDDLDDVFVPLPEGPKQKTPDPLDDIFIPLPGAAKLDPSAASANVGIVCPAGCTGTAVATPLARGARASAAKPLARARFTARPGVRTTIRLRFGAAARRAIRRAGGVRVALTARHGGTAPQRRTIAIRVRTSG